MFTYIRKLVVKGIIEKPLDELDKNFTNTILIALEDKLRRSLALTERQVFTMPRALMAYDILLDYIKNDVESIEEIKTYIGNVVKEYQNNLFSKEKIRVDWFNFLLGVVFLSTGIILLLVKFTYFEDKDRNWLYYGNVQLISGAVLGIAFGIYFIVTSL